jgi:hypothetical protein
LSIDGDCNIEWFWKGSYRKTRDNLVEYPDLEIDNISISNLKFSTAREKGYKGRYTNDLESVQIPSDVKS